MNARPCSRRDSYAPPLEGCTSGIVGERPHAEFNERNGGDSNYSRELPPRTYCRTTRPLPIWGSSSSKTWYTIGTPLTWRGTRATGTNGCRPSRLSPWSTSTAPIFRITTRSRMRLPYATLITPRRWGRPTRIAIPYLPAGWLRDVPTPAPQSLREPARSTVTGA